MNGSICLQVWVELKEYGVLVRAECLHSGKKPNQAKYWMDPGCCRRRLLLVQSCRICIDRLEALSTYYLVTVFVITLITIKMCGVFVDCLQ